MEKNHVVTKPRYSERILSVPVGPSSFGGYVVVQFYPWFNFCFPLFLVMVMYDNQFKTKKNKN